MKINYRVALLLFCTLLVLPQGIGFGGFASIADGWTEVAPGISYQKYHLTSPRPIDIFVTRMDRSISYVTIDSSIAMGRLSGGVETVRSMAARYDQAINYWGEVWGGRNQVVAAINGYFFGSPEELTGVPWSGQINSGWYAKRFTEVVGDAGFVWTLDRQADIGSCVYHSTARNYVNFKRAAYKRGINAINVARRQDELTILYTPQYDASTLTVNDSEDPLLEIQIELSRPALIIPADGEVLGIIRSIRDRQGSTQLPFDHVVLTAWGDARATLLSRIQGGSIAVGDSIGLTQEIQNCAVVPYVDWTKAYAGIGGDYHFLNDNIVRTDFGNADATVPNSRTAIAYSGAYVFFVVVDGWNDGVSEGITIPELGNFIKNTLGGTDAVSQDSGGSSTMVVNGAVVNNTYCNFTRDCGMQAAPGASEDSHASRDAVTADEDLEPLVGNGLLMVVVQPKGQSSAFTIGQQITARESASIRLGPGSNYASIATIPSGAQGVILDHAANLEGVLAKGSYWWKVSVNGVVGWIAQQSLLGGDMPMGVRVRLPIIMAPADVFRTFDAVYPDGFFPLIP